MEKKIPISFILIAIVIIFITLITKHIIFITLLIPLIYLILKEEARTENTLYLTLLIGTYLKLTRSLEKTMRIISYDSTNPFYKDIKRIIWTILTKRQMNLNETLSTIQDNTFLYTLTLMNSALGEGKNLFKNIDKAINYHIDAIYETSIQFIEQFINPLNIGFSLTILLPMMIITLLPILALIIQTQSMFVDIFYTLDILIPLIGLIVLYEVVKRRPLPMNLDLNIRYTFNIKDIILPSIFIALAFIFYYTSFFPNVNIPICLTFSIILFLRNVYKQNRPKFKEVEEIIYDMPILLKEISIHLDRGIPLEHIMKNIYKNNKLNLNKKTIELIKQYVYISIRADENNNIEVFLSSIPSSFLRNIFKIISLTASISPTQSAIIVEKLADYISKMREIETKIVDLMKEITANLQLMGSLTIPLISALALSFSLFLFTYLKTIKIQNFMINFTNIPISNSDISLLITLYSIEMTILSSLFLSMLKFKGNKIKILDTITNITIKGLIIFILSFYISYMLLGMVVKV